MASVDFKTQGDSAFREGRFQDAIIAYSNAIALDPDNAVLYSNRSGAYLSSGRNADADGVEALADAIRCIELKPDFVKGYSRKGAALRKLRQLDEAKKCYQQGLLLFPQDSSLQDGLRDVDKALALVPQALQSSSSAIAVGHSARLVEHIAAFLRHRRRINNLWKSFSTGMVEAVETVDNLETIVPSPQGQSDTFDPNMRQMALSGRPVANLNELYEVAALAREVFVKILTDDVEPQIPNLPHDRVHVVGLKGRERAAKKAQDDYSNRSSGPGEAWLFDIIRGSIECDTEDQIVAVINALKAHPAVHIVRLKNRFRKPTPAGFRDININLRVFVPTRAGADGGGEQLTVPHTCELQIHHVHVKEFSKVNDSHSHYEFFRVYFSGSVEAMADRLNTFEAIGAFDRGEDDDRDGKVEVTGERGSAVMEAAINEAIEQRDESKLMGLYKLLHQEGELVFAERVLRKLVEFSQQRCVDLVIGPDVVELAQRQNLLAANLQVQVRLAEARPLLADVLTKFQIMNTLSPSGIYEMEIALAQQHLGLLLQDLCELEEANVMFSEGCVLMRRLRGESHLLTAYCRENLGALLTQRGKLDEARPHLEQALFIRRSELGDSHTLVGTSLLRIAELHFAATDYEKSKEFSEQSLSIRRRNDGENHMRTIQAMAVYAISMQNLGQVVAAGPLLEHCLVVTTSTLGNEHPDTATAMNNLANQRLLVANYSEALTLLVRGLEVSCNVLGKEHALTATYCNNLGAVYHAMARFNEARPYFERCVKIRVKVLGENHPLTGKVCGDLGACVLMLGDLQSSLLLLERALAIHRVVGATTTEIATVLNSIGPLYQKLGRLPEAKKALTEALTRFRGALGDSDMTVATVYNNLGTVLRDCGEIEDSVKCLQTSLSLMTAQLGSGHLNTMNVSGNLGTALMQSKDPRQAAQGRAMVTNTIAYLRNIGCPSDHPYVLKFSAFLQPGSSSQGMAQAQPQPQPQQTPVSAAVSLPAGAQISCPNRHPMSHLTTNVPEYAAAGGFPRCDNCKKDIQFTAGFHHCPSCGYDLCPSCLQLALNPMLQQQQQYQQQQRQQQHVGGGAQALSPEAIMAMHQMQYSSRRGCCSCAIL